MRRIKQRSGRREAETCYKSNYVKDAFTRDASPARVANFNMGWVASLARLGGVPGPSPGVSHVPPTDQDIDGATSCIVEDTTTTTAHSIYFLLLPTLSTLATRDIDKAGLSICSWSPSATLPPLHCVARISALAHQFCATQPGRADSNTCRTLTIVNNDQHYCTEWELNVNSVFCSTRVLARPIVNDPGSPTTAGSSIYPPPLCQTLQDSKYQHGASRLTLG